MASSKKTEAQDNDGLTSLIGERVILLCMNYFYYGKLVAVNEDNVALDESYIVYETGNWNEKQWKDAQKLGEEVHYVSRGAIESYRKAEKTAK